MRAPSDHQRLEDQWTAELARHLHQTGWIVQRAGVTRLYCFRVASVYHVVTGHTLQIAVSEIDARTSATRRGEILRQLADSWVAHRPPDNVVAGMME